MSRAFTKDDDDKPERPIPRPSSDSPNYVTPEGLARLNDALAKARDENDARNADYFEMRVASAIVVDKPPKDARKVAFGATVSVRSEGKTIRLRIVGEDEADPLHGTIAWSAPYAQALLDRRAGDRVVVPRPAGAVTVTIEKVVWE